MLAPGQLPVQHRISKDDPPAWNDPRRQIFPHHEEFWPCDLPEHVLFEKENRRRIRERRLQWLKAIFLPAWLRPTAKEKRAQTIAEDPFNDPGLVCKHESI